MTIIRSFLEFRDEAIASRILASRSTHFEVEVLEKESNLAAGI